MRKREIAKREAWFGTVHISGGVMASAQLEQIRQQLDRIYNVAGSSAEPYISAPSIGNVRVEIAIRPGEATYLNLIGETPAQWAIL